MTEAVCPLCLGHDTHLWHEDRQRQYLRCQQCALVFVPPRFHLSPAAEKALYDLHCNQVDDPGYQRFLNRVLEPLAQRVKAPAQGLDFGCGPGPALAQMLRVAGYAVTLYDKFYFPAATALEQRYDFITATEVLEHLQAPRAVLQTLLDCLSSGGWLAIMTKRVRDQQAFSRWHYIHDPTHIAFFSDATFAWIAGHWHCQLTLCGPDVVLLQKA